MNTSACGLSRSGNVPGRLAALTIALGVAAVGTAVADPPATDLSGASPYPPACRVANPAAAPGGDAGAPHVIADPGDPEHLVAVFAQGPHGIRSAASWDAGRSWQRSLLPGLAECAGGTDEQTVAYNWLAVGAGGAAYSLSASGIVDSHPLFRLTSSMRLLLNRSPDGGRTWQDPIVVDDPPPGTIDENPAIGAHPTDPRQLHAVFLRARTPLGDTYDLLHTRSLDGGRTWSSPRTIHAPSFGTTPVPSGVTVRPDGTVVLALGLWRSEAFLPAYPVETSTFGQAVMRSADGGATWTAPHVVGRATPRFPVERGGDPQRRSQNVVQPAMATASDGRLFMVWEENRESASRIVHATSCDAGRTWSRPRTVAEVRGQAFTPAIAVAPDGSLGVTWYDDRSDAPGGARWDTDAWIARSRDGGASWHVEHLAGPFDLRSAHFLANPLSGGYFLGNYQGLAGVPDGFVSVRTFARPLAHAAATSVMAARVVSPVPLRVTAHPRRLHAGRLTRVTILVRSGSRPVVGARVRVHSTRALTNTAGRAALRVRLRRGRTRLRVTAPNGQETALRLSVR